MTRKLKTLGVALFAVLALTAVAASAASAANYTASAYPTTGTALSALGNDLFITEAGKFECKGHFQSTLNAAGPDLSVKVHDTECKAFGFLNATVSDCTYTFTEPTGSNHSYTAKIDIVSTCTVLAGTCEYKIEPQGPLSSATITNDTAAGDVSFKANVTGIAYTVTKDGIGCPFSGTGAKTGATYTQTNAITFDSTNGAIIDVG
jgi:hypothetical protein